MTRTRLGGIVPAEFVVCRDALTATTKKQPTGSFEPVG